MADFVDKVLHDAGVEVTHHFGGGVYIKECEVPPNMYLEQHVHEFDHMATLVKGVAILTIDGEAHLLHAPKTLLIKAGSVHGVKALTNVVWNCIWREDLAKQMHKEKCGEK